MADKISVEDEKKVHTIKKNLNELKEYQVLNTDLRNLKDRIVDNLNELTTPLAIFIRDAKILEDEIFEVIKDENLAYLYNDPLFHKIEQQIKASNNRFLIQERINQLMSQFLISVCEETNNISKVTAPTQFLPEDTGMPRMTQEDINDLRGKVNLLMSKYSDYSHSKKRIIMFRINEWANNKERFAIIENVIEQTTGEKLLTKYRTELQQNKEVEPNDQS